MLAASSKLLRFCLFPSQKPHSEFHTSACVHKGASRGGKRPSKTRADAQPTRSSSRKRLVPSLKPDGNSGTYEVAPRPSKNLNDKPHGRNGRDQVLPPRMATDPPHSIKEDPSSSNQTAFLREHAPHVGRTSWQGPRRSPSRREGRIDYGNGFDRRTSPFYGLRRNDDFARQGDDFRSRSVSFRGEATPETSHIRRSFGERLSRGKDVFQGRNAYGPDAQVHSTRPSKGLVPQEFDISSTEPLKTLPARFASPPLLSGLLQSVHDVLGPETKPSPIQSLSLKHLFTPPSHIFSTGMQDEKTSPLAPHWRQHLLASETGSGKSIAYLLPMIQYLKLTEDSPTHLLSPVPPAPDSPVSLNPRGLILAPTHELSRQLSTFAKALLHNVRLRVLCASRANNFSSSRGKKSTASQMKRELDDNDFGMTDGTQNLRRSRPIDILVGTPSKVLEMVRGWGWNREDKIEDQWDDARKDRARKWVPGPPEAALGNVEWVVVDEADILFDNDFKESTRMLLADIARARGYTHPSFSPPQNSSIASANSINSSHPVEYPFHLILTSATIPSSLATYLATNHPKLTRLASPNLHRLPSTLKTEHHAWTSGNKNSDIEKRIRHVWADDARSHVKSKILIFCNKSSKVEDLGLYLTEKGIPNVALTSTAEARFRGSNRHLAGFLKTTEDMSNQQVRPVDTSKPASRSDPHVMITTSLLSRGLDFSPQIKHVFIMDEPRNMIDFLHRAGRSGRAGNEGKVVVFGKMKGRGSENAREVKRKIGALAH